MMKTFIKNLWSIKGKLIISFFYLLLVLLYSLKEHIFIKTSVPYKIDTFVFIISFFIFLPWSIHFFTKIKLPWGIELDINKLEKLHNKIKESNLNKNHLSETGLIFIDIFDFLSSKDLSLAILLFKRQIDLYLKKICNIYKITETHSTRHMLESLLKNKVIEAEYKNIFIELDILFKKINEHSNLKQENRIITFINQHGPSLIDYLENKSHINKD